MAKIVCEYDSVEKTLKVTKDGTGVKADCFSANVYYDSYDNINRGYCEISYTEYDKDNKLASSTRISANEKGEMVNSSDLNTDLLKDVSEFFKK